MITSRIRKLMVKISVVDLGSCYTVHRYCSHCPLLSNQQQRSGQFWFLTKLGITITTRFFPCSFYDIIILDILPQWHDSLSLIYPLPFFPFSTIPNPLHFHFGTAKTSRPSFFPLKQMGIWNPCKRKTIHINLGFHKKILLLFWVNEIDRRVSMDLLRP